MLLKRTPVPVVTVVHHGNHLHSPFWNFRKKRRVPLHTTATKILTAEQIREMSPEQINEAIRTALTYDEYQYQKEKWLEDVEKREGHIAIVLKKKK